MLAAVFSVLAVLVVVVPRAVLPPALLLLLALLAALRLLLLLLLRVVVLCIIGVAGGVLSAPTTDTHTDRTVWECRKHGDTDTDDSEMRVESR